MGEQPHARRTSLAPVPVASPSDADTARPRSARDCNKEPELEITETISDGKRDESSTHSSEVGSCFASSRRAFFPGDDFAAARDDVTLVLLRDFDAV